MIYLLQDGCKLTLGKTRRLASASYSVQAHAAPGARSVPIPTRLAIKSGGKSRVYPEGYQSTMKLQPSRPWSRKLEEGSWRADKFVEKAVEMK